MDNKENKNNIIENKKLKENFSKAMKKTADGISKGVNIASQKTKQAIINHQIKKYKPLFLKEFKSKNFNIPNIIKIVDDAVRRDIGVCEGAIGWTSTENGTEVLFLYDEAVANSGIEFIPNVGCDQLYYVDHFNRKRFIQVNCIFERAHSEKLAELEHIAYSLGAKSCLIEIIESNTDKQIQSKKQDAKNASDTSVEYKGVSANHKTSGSFKKEEDISSEEYSGHSGRTKTYFEGNNVPIRPNLKWFANDENIKGLIEMRCSNNNSIISRTLRLEGSTSATMSQSIACTIDSLINEGISLKKVKATKTNQTQLGSSMLSKSIKENNRTLLFEIEF